MSGMAELLAGHYEYNWEPDAESWECQCGPLLGEDVFRRDADPNHRTHQAAMLAAAGFGPVKEASAKALEDAADENAVRSDTLLKTMQNMADSREYELADIVRYGAFSAEAKAMESRLRARAAAVRGEG